VADLAHAFPCKGGAGLSERACVQEILLHGSHQQSTAERRALIEQRRAFVVNHFVSTYIEPRSGLPHPASRVAAAMEAAKVRIPPLPLGTAQRRLWLQSLVWLARSISSVANKSNAATVGTLYR